MLDDLTKEIKAQLYERVKSPLFGAFALSWVAWNYRAILAVISDMPFKDRMTYLDGVYPTGWDWFLHCLGGPLLTSMAFLLIYPWPARWMYSYWAGQQKELKKVQQRIEDETPLTQEEANALRRGGLTQGKEYQSQLRELAASNKELEEQIKLLQEDCARLEREREQFSNAAKKAQEELTPHLAKVVQAGPVLRDAFAQSPQPVGYPSLEGANGLLSSVGDEKSVIRRQAEESALKLLRIIARAERIDLQHMAVLAGIDKGAAHRGIDHLIKQGLVTSNGDLWMLSPKGHELCSTLGFF